MPVYLTLSIDQEIVEVLGEAAIIAYMSQHMKKGILWFLWFVDLQIYMSSPLFGLQMCLLPEGSSSLYYMSAGVVGWCEGAVYLTSLGRPTDIGLQLGKACYPCSR